jgi:hypothetical protein
MADVYAVFGTLLALGIIFPGMLTAWWLLFPAWVGRAESRLSKTPGRSFGFGLLGAIMVAIPVVILLALPFGPAKFLGSFLLMASLIIASLGASGLAALMASRLVARSGAEAVGLKNFVGGAVALELAAIFPLLGWLIVIPFTIITCLGASLFALLGWMPRPTEPDAEPAVRPGSLRREPQSA